MRIVVTGAAGFIGRALVAALDGASRVFLGGGHRIVTTDVVDGDIADAAHVERLFAAPVDLVFHLAAIASGAAEADFDAGKRVNLDATMRLIDRCRGQKASGGPLVRFVYASSIAVFGTPLPARIDDATEPRPTLSYGTHKRICELLIDDATRRGELDGRALRLPGIVVRPAQPNGALSAFNSELIREPLAGRELGCPVGPHGTIWIAPIDAAVAGLLRLAEVDGAAIGAQRAVTAPALAVSIEEIVAALGRVDRHAPARVRFRPVAAIEAQFARWPRDAEFARAESLGLARATTIDAIVRRYREASAAEPHDTHAGKTAKVAP